MTPAPDAKGFFAVDHGAFRAASLGGLNAAVAHLVMARGTARDNRTTQWSANSISQRTGISRRNASKAVRDLVVRNIWAVKRDGKHPIYECTAGREIPRGSLSGEENNVLNAISRNECPSASLSAALATLKAKGLVLEGDQSDELQIQETLLYDHTIRPWVWMPNTLIDGAVDEIPPLELIRQTRSLSALRLLVDLYGAQFLPDYFGVPRDMLRRSFDRAKVGEHADFIVWGFRDGDIISSRDLIRPFMTSRSDLKNGRKRDTGIDDYNDAVQLLLNLGLLEGVGMLLEGDDTEAEIIHPYGFEGGELAEQELALAALEAAIRLLRPEQIEQAATQGYCRLVPVRRHIRNVCMNEVYRLKYRPQTSATATWYAEMQRTAAEYLPRYERISRSAAAPSRRANARCTL